MISDIIENLKVFMETIGSYWLTPEYFKEICQVLIERFSSGEIPIALMPLTALFGIPFIFLIAYLPAIFGFLASIIVPIIERFG